jgi:hypothetical protein
MSIDNLSRAERIRGGLYGLLVGHALGVPYEFHGAWEDRTCRWSRERAERLSCAPLRDRGHESRARRARHRQALRFGR